MMSSYYGSNVISFQKIIPALNEVMIDTVSSYD